MTKVAEEKLKQKIKDLNIIIKDLSEDCKNKTEKIEHLERNGRQREIIRVNEVKESERNIAEIARLERKMAIAENIHKVDTEYLKEIDTKTMIRIKMAREILEDAADKRASF